MKEPLSLPEGFEVLIDGISEEQYNQAFYGFRDATIYQTWAYNHIRSSGAGTVALLKKGVVRALAQVRITRLPLVPVGVAYVNWGPVWQTAQGQKDYQVLSIMLQAIRSEYVRRRGMFLLVRPNLYDVHADAGRILSSFHREGYHLLGSDIQVALLDLTQPIEGLRQGLRGTWRRRLQAAEKEQLQVVDGRDVDMLRRFRSLYEEMTSRKGIQKMNMEEFEEIYCSLPAPLRPLIRLCWRDGEPVAGGVFSVTGKKAIYLHGATSNAAIQRRLNAGHFLQWSVIEWLNQQGFEEYDLSGADPDRSEGTYQFKAGLCGTHWSNGCITAMWLFGSCQGYLRRSVISALVTHRAMVYGT
jgi:lipid II:glycine glycyltransferase (peptidoglycan interpeptide bridge formation enzyme)